MGDELQFDTKMTDTTLAEDFLKKEKIFESTVTLKEKDALLYDYTLNVLEKLNTCNHVYQFRKDYVLHHLKQNLRSLNGDMIVPKSLYQGIAENIEIIKQLEYLVRHVSTEETEFNLNLISSYAGRWQKCEELAYPLFLYFDQDTPLACIAAVAESRKYKAIILCTIEVTPLVRLLTNILRECGYEVEMLITEALESMPWVCREEIKEIVHKKQVSEFASGCIAVVTESADLDAAVDVCVSSFIQNPWKIQKVLVQENVHDSFKKVLRWKWERQCKTNANSHIVPKEIQSKCTAVYKFNDKAFLLDYADTNLPQEMRGATLVEAYRTSQELSSLIKKYSPFGLTIWCNDVCVANKIAYEPNVSLSWINDYGFFKGCSNVFFNKIWVSTSTDIREDVAVANTNFWSKYDYRQRQEIIRDKLSQQSYKEAAELIQMIDVLLSSGAESPANHNEVSVDNLGQSIVINTPRAHISSPAFSESLHYAKALTLLIERNIIVFNDLYTFPDILGTFQKAFENGPIYNTKAIYTRFS